MPSHLCEHAPGGDGEDVLDGGDGRERVGDGYRGVRIRSDVRGDVSDDVVGDARREKDGGDYG